MQIELMGCTSAGKSTLATGALRALREQSIEAWSAEDFVLRLARLGWVEGSLARTVLLDFLATAACLVARRRYTEFYRFLARLILRLPAKVGWLERINIVRNTIKKIGVYEIVRRRASYEQVVIVDEGTLHTAHYLFVHVSAEPETTDLSMFASLVPLPDVAVYLREDEATLIARTIERGHRRIPDRSYTSVERFISRAAATFDMLVQYHTVAERLLVVDRLHNTISGKISPDEPAVSMAQGIVAAGTRAAYKPAAVQV